MAMVLFGFIVMALQMLVRNRRRKKRGLPPLKWL
jgi:hypothetical protein